MTEEQILEIMTAYGHPQFDGTVADLAGLYAGRLAAISDRISQQELAELISIGVAFYQNGIKELKAEVEAHAKFETDELLRHLKNDSNGK